MAHCPRAWPRASLEQQCQPPRLSQEDAGPGGGSALPRTRRFAGGASPEFSPGGGRWRGREAAAVLGRRAGTRGTGRGPSSGALQAPSSAPPIPSPRWVCGTGWLPTPLPGFGAPQRCCLPPLCFMTRLPFPLHPEASLSPARHQPGMWLTPEPCLQPARSPVPSPPLQVAPKALAVTSVPWQGS